MQIISGLKGTHFDPEVVDAFIVLEDQLNRIRAEKLRNEKKVIPAAAGCQQKFQQASGMR
jgi:HD-GYP domain-containing protein (c-di-GMP phosphodiesterase class II)